MVDVSAVFEKLVDDIDVAFSSGSLQRSGRCLSMEKNNNNKNKR
jgi:hypothetical protein